MTADRTTGVPNERGRKNYDELFPGHVSTVNDPELIETFDNFAFDEVLQHGSLDARTRELLTFSMLVALGGADAQVKGHVAANLNVGNSRAQLIEVLTELLPFIGYPRTLNGLTAIDQIAPPTATPS